jgi:hypothetical protein
VSSRRLNDWSNLASEQDRRWPAVQEAAPGLATLPSL